MTQSIINVAIIAHVDHGKTTLVGKLLKQSGIFRNNDNIHDEIMDCNAIEQERKITILAKTTSLEHDGIKYNIVDTPGHADFGGEVERILSMVNGAILLVDASEGPMPQTKFVLNKALQIGLKPIVIINKVDRQDRRINEVVDEIFELFISLNATDEQLNFPILYAVGRDGWASLEQETQGADLNPVFDTLKKHVPQENLDLKAPCSMLSTILTYDQYVGRILIGKIYSGVIKIGDQLKSINLSGETVENFRCTKLFGFRGIERMPIEQASAGDIVAIAGMEKTSVADTICSPEVTIPIQSTPVDPPTMAITIGVNDSPFAGTEGKKVTSRAILERLKKEAETNVAISLTISSNGESFEIGGRGELQLGVLIETMRREGFELSVSKPRVLFKEGESRAVLEPIEEIVIDVDEEYSGIVIETLSQRRGTLIEMKNAQKGKMRIVFQAPSRGLIGYQSQFRNDTRGTGIMSRVFSDYQPYKGEITSRNNGALISNSDGETSAYALWNLEERGMMFVDPKTKVYPGMIIGEHTRNNDLEVNPVRGKQLTNIRAAGSDENIKLTPAKKMTLEEAMSYIKDDEVVEVTPMSVRLRKRLLCPNERKRTKK